MRILLISSLYPPFHRSGAEVVVETAARALREAGHAVAVLTTGPLGKYGPKPKVGEVDGVTVYRFWPFNLCWFGNLGKLPAPLRVIWHLLDVFGHHAYVITKNVIAEFKPDVVWTHNLKGIGYLVPLAIRQSGVKHVHTLHDVQLAIPSGLLIAGQEHSWAQRTILRKWYEAICRKLFGSPAVVTAPSQWLLSFYRERGFFPESKQELLRNPIAAFVISSGAIRGSDLSSVAPAKEESRRGAENGGVERSPHFIAASREVRFLDSVPPRLFANGTVGETSLEMTDENDFGGVVNILHVGQLEPHKGTQFLLQLWERLNDPRLHLWIAAYGSLHGLVEAAAAKDSRIHYVGQAWGEELEPCFQRCQYAILPTMCYENSPVFVQASLAHGLPVLVSDLGGAGELVEEGKTGWRLPAGDLAAWEQALRQLLDRAFPEKGNLLPVALQEYDGREFVRRVLSL